MIRIVCAVSVIMIALIIYVTMRVVEGRNKPMQSGKQEHLTQKNNESANLVQKIHDHSRVNSLFDTMAAETVESGSFDFDLAALKLESSDIPFVLVRLVSEINNKFAPKVVSACLSVSPLVTLASINELEKLAGSDAIKKLVYLKIGSFSHKAKIDLSHMESVKTSDCKAIIELMQLGGNETAKDFLSVSNVFSALILAGREYDHSAFNVLKMHQSALEEKFDVVKILDYATSPVGGIRNDVLSLYREYCLERLKKDGDPLANEIINYIEEL